MTTQSTSKQVQLLVVAITMALVAAVVLAIAPGTASAAPKFACSVDGQGTLKWDDNGAERYWVYRSTDGGNKYEWLGRSLGGTSFSDAGAPAGALYQVHYQGISRTDCTGVVNTSAPASSTQQLPFDCEVKDGSISWSDHGVSKYWVYRSLDGGNKYEWLGRTLGDTKMVDPKAPAGALYQVHYNGIPRENCTGTNPQKAPAPKAPVVDEKLVVDFKKPVIDFKAPVIEKKAPVLDIKAPVIDFKAPVMAPVIEKAPVLDFKAPVADLGGFGDFGFGF